MNTTSIITPQDASKASTARLREVAQELETVFLAEMLKSAGVGKTPKEFGGGAGEDQFSSFLVTEQAMSLSSAGGIGLAEHIFKAMEKTQ